MRLEVQPARSLNIVKQLTQPDEKNETPALGVEITQLILRQGLTALRPFTPKTGPVSTVELE